MNLLVLSVGAANCTLERDAHWGFLHKLSWLQSNGLGRHDMPDGHALLFHDDLIHHELQDFLFNGKARGLQGVPDTGTELLEAL